MFVVATCRVAKVIVSIVTKGHIYHATTTEVLYALGVESYGIAVLDAEHQGTAAFALEAVEVVGSIGNIHTVCTACYHSLYFGEQSLGFGKGGVE